MTAEERAAEPVADYIARVWRPRAKIRLLIERDGLKCHWCDKLCNPKLKPSADLFPTKEHLIRRADGGSNGMENLVVACRKCNNGRHSNWKEPWTYLDAELNRKVRNEP